MAFSSRQPGEQVTVITGASSGIGRATARAFAERGASVVLAARREQSLREVAAECERLGGRAIAVPTDVTDENAMHELARQAAETFGRIDIWVNNAGAGLFGPFCAGQAATHRRVVEINLFGTMNGAAAVLPYFLERGRGLLINNISMGGWAPTPFAAAYTASKFALRGFTASLRQELAHRPGIRVCAVFPSFIDTPGFQHGANLSGRAIQPGSPIYPPEAVADAIVSLVESPRDEVAVGWPARAAQLAYALAPGAFERAMGRGVRRYIKQADPAPLTQGSLFKPMKAGTGVSGGWQARPQARTGFGRGIALVALALAGTGLLAAAVSKPAR